MSDQSGRTPSPQECLNHLTRASVRAERLGDPGSTTYFLSMPDATAWLAHVVSLGGNDEVTFTVSPVLSSADTLALVRWCGLCGGPCRHLSAPARTPSEPGSQPHDDGAPGLENGSSNVK